MILVSPCRCLGSIHWNQVLSQEWRCSWSSADRQCSNYIWMINGFIGASYIRGLTVLIIIFKQIATFHKRFSYILESWGMNKFCRSHFQMHFRNRNCCIFHILLNFGSNRKYVSTDIGNGLALNGNDLGGRFKNTYQLLNLRALKSSPLNKIHIFQCMGEIFCVEFQRVTLKFHTKYLTHTLKDVDFIHIWKFKSS